MKRRDLVALARIHFRIAIQQQLSCLSISVLAGQVQGGAVIQLRGIHFCPTVQQQLGNSNLSYLTRQVEYSAAVLRVLPLKRLLVGVNNPLNEGQRTSHRSLAQQLQRPCLFWGQTLRKGKFRHTWAQSSHLLCYLL